MEIGEMARLKIIMDCPEEEIGQNGAFSGEHQNGRKNLFIRRSVFGAPAKFERKGLFFQ